MRRTFAVNLISAGIVLLLIPGVSRARSALADSTDIKIRNNSGTDAIGAENSIFIHPTDSRIILENHSGANAWVSLTGGKGEWYGDNGPGGGSGDPAAVIRKSVGSTPVRYVIEHNGPDRGQEALYKDSATSLTWTLSPIVDKTLGDTDKPHMWVDNYSPDQNGGGNLYVAWSNFTKRVETIRSINGGESWINRVPAIDTDATKADFGVNLKVGISTSPYPNYLGHVYAVWGKTTGPQFSDQIGSILFNKSTDFGVTWGTETLVASLNDRGFHGREQLPGGNTMGANSAPSMAVDNVGNIYVVWGQKNENTQFNDAEVYLVKSTDEGATWTAPERVNQDTGTADQWLPWVTWDDCTSALVVVFFDGRNDNTRAETYLAVKYLGGVGGWIERKISDVSWSGDCVPVGLAGDYISVAARDGIAYPVWSDDRETTNTFKPYVSPIYLWGVDQSSVQHSIVNGPGMQLDVTASWTTNLSASGTDYLVITSPDGVIYTGTATPSSPYTSHTVTKTCTCERGQWTYVVKSTRPNFTSRGSDPKTFTISACLD